MGFQCGLQIVAPVRTRIMEVIYLPCNPEPFLQFTKKVTWHIDFFISQRFTKGVLVFVLVFALLL